MDPITLGVAALAGVGGMLAGSSSFGGDRVSQAAGVLNAPPPPTPTPAPGAPASAPAGAPGKAGVQSSFLSGVAGGAAGGGLPSAGSSGPNQKTLLGS